MARAHGLLVSLGLMCSGGVTAMRLCCVALGDGRPIRFQPCALVGLPACGCRHGRGSIRRGLRQHEDYGLPRLLADVILGAGGATGSVAVAAVLKMQEAGRAPASCASRRGSATSWHGASPGGCCG